MQQSRGMAESLFNEALKLPAGRRRLDFLEERCKHNPELRQEVESLLNAHDKADGFLETSVQIGPATSSAANESSVGHSETRSPVDHAAAFLRTTRDGGTGIDAYLTGLPAEARRETQERIEAGLRLRSVSELSMAAKDLAAEIVPSFPGYRIDGRIGSGSLGVVYRAHDQKLNRAVALKVLRPQGDAPIIRRLLAEARQVAALNHPAVVTIFSVLDDCNPPAIVMELVDGYPLDRFAEHLTFDQKARLLREVARGLAAAHEHGLIHRDLKPENVMVGPDMRPRILDFGLALSLDEAVQRKCGFEGTPLYASPEQVRSQALSTASDVFSFGCLMFKVLTGRPPFTGTTVGEVLEAIATTSPPMLREVAVGVPEDLQAICLACLAWSREDRPTSPEIVVELGRFLAGEPVQLRPKLYDDLLRRSISEYAGQTRRWVSQSIISGEESDALEVVHRRLLADEDHWIIDARRITLPQTILSAGTWLTVVATALTVWMLRAELGPFLRWLLPVGFTLSLLLAGAIALRWKESVAAATFLAGAVLAIAPCTLALLGEVGVFAEVPENVVQLFGTSFSNAQVAAAAWTALLLSTLSLWRLKMTGFAWTTAALATAGYGSILLLWNWLDRKPEIQSLWCLPLVLMEFVGLYFERAGRVRWTLPFHLVALTALVFCLDIMAWQGPTLKMVGFSDHHWTYLNEERLQAFSLAGNGLLFLILMLLAERAVSLDLRRASKILEVLAILHTLSALFANAMHHRDAPYVRIDVWMYVGFAVLFVLVAPFRSRWRMLVGGLVGCGLGSYLLVELGLVPRQPFIVILGLLGLAAALGAFAYVRGVVRLR